VEEEKWLDFVRSVKVCNFLSADVNQAEAATAIKIPHNHYFP